MRGQINTASAILPDFALTANCPLFRMMQSGNGTQYRGFTAAGRPNQRQYVTGPAVYINI
jgi:hypothetical protein